jgi:hypothetical protein
VIDRDEIDAMSKLLGVHTSDVQRDYQYGWRKGGTGQEYLYIWDQTGGHSAPGIKSFSKSAGHSASDMFLDRQRRARSIIIVVVGLGLVG